MTFSSMKGMSVAALGVLDVDERQLVGDDRPLDEALMRMSKLSEEGKVMVGAGHLELLGPDVDGGDALLVEVDVAEAGRLGAGLGARLPAWSVSRPWKVIR